MDKHTRARGRGRPKWENGGFWCTSKVQDLGCCSFHKFLRIVIGMQECTPGRPFCVILEGNVLETGRQDRGCVCLWWSVPRKSGRPSRSVHLCERPLGGAAWQFSSVGKDKMASDALKGSSSCETLPFIININDEQE